MINEDYHESILLFNATSKTKNGRKLEYDYLYKIPSNRDGVFEDFKEIHEHLLNSSSSVRSQLQWKINKQMRYM